MNRRLRTRVGAGLLLGTLAGAGTLFAAPAFATGSTYDCRTSTTFPGGTVRYEGQVSAGTLQGPQVTFGSPPAGVDEWDYAVAGGASGPAADCTALDGLTFSVASGANGGDVPAGALYVVGYDPCYCSGGAVAGLPGAYAGSLLIAPSSDEQSAIATAAGTVKDTLLYIVGAALLIGAAVYALTRAWGLVKSYAQ